MSRAEMMLKHVLMSMQPNVMPIVEHRNVMYRGHTVQIFKDHTGEPKYYFRCKHCGTQYMVWESDCECRYYYTGERSTMHPCPNCNTNNTGNTGYRNGYGRNGYESSCYD